MSDERKIDEELDSDDDVEAHKKTPIVNVSDEGKDEDDDGDVEAHMKGLTR